MAEVTSELETLARRLAQIRTSKEDLDNQLEELNAEEDMIKVRLKELMESLEMPKFHITGAGLVYFQTSFFPKIVGDPIKTIEWLDDHEGKDISPRKINQARLKEYYEERMGGDLEVPPSELVEAKTVAEVRFRQDKLTPQQG